MTIDQIRETIEAHNALRAQCLAYLKSNPECLGKNSWLSGSIQKGDFSLEVTTTGIEAYGSIYSSQVADHEWFTFTVPFEALTRDTTDGKDS